MSRVKETRYSTPTVVLKTGHYVIHHSGLGLIRSLGRLGVPIYAVIENRFTPAARSRYLTGTFVWDTRGLARPPLVEGLENIGRRLDRRTILIPTDDFAAILIAEEAAKLRRWFIFPESDPNIPRAVANKKLLHGLCKERRIPHPDAVFPNSIRDVHQFLGKATFPVVVKVASGWLNTTKTASVRIVHSPEELLAIYNQAEADQVSNCFIQEYIPDGENWFFHGYCNARSDCLAAFTGQKLRSYPPHAGYTVLGKSVSNDTLRAQAEMLLKAISYAGIVDIDYRFDRRDGQYKILDFNPRVGAQFRLFEDREGTDVARALYRDLTGEAIRRSPQVDNRVIIIEFDDLRASLRGFWNHELTVRDWWRSFKGTREFAWFKWNDPAPFVMVCVLMVIKGVAKSARLAGRLLGKIMDSGWQLISLDRAQTH